MSNLSEILSIEFLKSSLGHLIRFDEVEISTPCALCTIKPSVYRYQVKPLSSPWFSAACAAVIVHRNHFVKCTNRVNLRNLK